MTVIKNTAELVKRARWHARYDHIEQGTYGESECNGEAEFKGCAIGCLATPHGKRRLRDFIKKFGDPRITEDKQVVWELSEMGDDQVARLTKEFGINERLARAAEAIFEGFGANGRAINFIPAFAAALPEGVNITPRQVQKAWKAAGGSVDSYGDLCVATGWDDFTTAEDIEGPFLDWLRSLKKD